MAFQCSALRHQLRYGIRSGRLLSINDSAEHRIKRTARYVLRKNQTFRFAQDAAWYFRRYLVLHIQINILINIHVVNGLGVLRQRNKLVNVLSRVVRTKMSLVLGQDLRLSLLTAQTVAKRSFDNLLVKDGAVLESNGKRVGNSALLRVVVVLGELWVLNTADLLTQGLDEGGLSGLAVIGVVAGFEAVEYEHSGNHVLHAVVTIGEVLHGLELLVDDADAGLVGAVDDVLNVLGRLAHGLELLVQALSGLDGSLGVELG